MQGSQILGVFDACADDLGESAEEMSTRGGELVAADEPAVISEPLLDSIVVEDGQGDGCFPDPPWTDESDWGEVLCETDNLLDQIVASETGPRLRGRWLSEYARCKRKAQKFPVVKAADLVLAYAAVSILLSPAEQMQLALTG